MNLGDRIDRHEPHIVPVHRILGPGIAEPRPDLHGTPPNEKGQGSVAATLPPFARQGSKVDITVSSLGNAKSLSGGTLAVTPLMGADGEVYAAAQGEVQIGGFSAQGQGASVSRGVPTSGENFSSSSGSRFAWVMSAPLPIVLPQVKLGRL